MPRCTSRLFTTTAIPLPSPYATTKIAATHTVDTTAVAPSISDINPIEPP